MKEETRGYTSLKAATDELAAKQLSLRSEMAQEFVQEAQKECLSVIGSFPGKRVLVRQPEVID